MKFGTRVSFRSGNANFCARPGKSRDDAETFMLYDELLAQGRLALSRHNHLLYKWVLY